MLEVMDLLTEPVHGTVPDMSELYTIIAINSNKLIRLAIRSPHNDLVKIQPMSSKVVADKIDTMGPT